MGLGWKPRSGLRPQLQANLWAGTPGCCAVKQGQTSGHTQASLPLLLPSDLPLCQASPAQSRSPCLAPMLLPFPMTWRQLLILSPSWPFPHHTFLRVEGSNHSILHFSAFMLNQQHCCLGWYKRRRAARTRRSWSSLQVGAGGGGGLQVK